MSSRSSSSTPQIRFSAWKSRLASRSRLVEQRAHRRIEAVARLQAAGPGTRRGRGQTARPDRTSGRPPARLATSLQADAQPLGDLAEIGRADSRPRRARRPARRRSAARPDRRRRSAICSPTWSRSVTRRCGQVLEIEAFAERSVPPEPAELPLRLRGPVRAGCDVPGSSGKMFSSEASSLSAIASALERRRRHRRTSRLRCGLGGARLAPRRPPRAPRPAPAAGLRSISSSTKRSSSTWVSCSSRIDCISCGVITSDCDWRSCNLAASAMSLTQILLSASGPTSAPHFPGAP